MAFAGIGPKIFWLASYPVHYSRRGPAKRRVSARGVLILEEALAEGLLDALRWRLIQVEPAVDYVSVHTFLKHETVLGL